MSSYRVRRLPVIDADEAAVRDDLGGRHRHARLARGVRGADRGDRDHGAAALLRSALMWRCPTCGQTFVTRNMPHSCQVVALGDHFAGV